MVETCGRESTRFNLDVYIWENQCHDSVLRYAHVPDAARNFTLIRPVRPGKSMWLFGVIGQTQNGVQPVSRYTLDNQRVSTMVADAQNETVYDQLFAHFYNLDLSYHSLVVENINEGGALYLDYYLVEPIPEDEVAKAMGSFPSGGEPLTTSISEHAMLTMNPLGNAAIGPILAAVIGSILLVLLIGIIAFVFLNKKRGAKPYYYQSAPVHEVLSDGMHQPLPSHPQTVTRSVEFESDKKHSRRDSAASTLSYPSSIYSWNGDQSPLSPTSRKTYFPTPSEYQSQKLTAGSTRSKSSRLSLTPSTYSFHSPSSHEQRPLL